MRGNSESRARGYAVSMVGRAAVALVMAGACVASVVPAPAHAQQGVVAGQCAEGEEPRGSIGISSFECTNCRLYSSGGQRVWNFSSEPVVRRVGVGTPADGKIAPGDEIVAIDGHLITTGEGGRRLANPEPGREVAIVVRTGSRERTVRLVPERTCPGPEAGAPPAVAVAPTDAAAPAADAVVSSGVAVGVPRAAVAPPADAARAAGVVAAAGPVPRPTYTLLPSGWFGFGIRCTDCRWSVDEETGESKWAFSSPPEISSVQEGSPAARAGLRRGDVLIEIDGHELVSAEGGSRFGSVRPGQAVRWTYVRAGGTRTTAATAARRPDLPSPPSRADAPSPAASAGVGPSYVSERAGRLRYSGLIGQTSVEVRGAGSVVVNIIEPGREIEIVTSDSRTRVRLEQPR